MVLTALDPSESNTSLAISGNFLISTSYFLVSSTSLLVISEMFLKVAVVNNTSAFLLGATPFGLAF